MYNENIKNRFIEDSFGNKENTKNNARKIFNNIEKIENRHHEDGYYMSYVDLGQELLDTIVLSSYKMYYDHLYHLKRYKEWCMMNGIFGEMVPIADFKEVKLHEMYTEALKEILIRSRLEFDSYLNIIFENYDSNDDYVTDDDFLKTVLLLLYDGLPEKAIFSLEIGDISITNNVLIKYDNVTIEIEDTELKKLLKKRLSKSHYGYLRSYGRHHKHLTFEMSNKLIDFVNVPNNKHKFSVLRYNKLLACKEKMCILNPKYESALRSFNIYVCGTISRMKAYETLKKCKFKRKEIFEWFFKSDLASRWKKEQIIDIYNAW